MSPPVVLFDLDGTLADNTHRQHFLATGKRDWDSFFEAQIDDTPNAPVVALYQALFASDRFEVIIVTARPERYRQLSESWLRLCDIPFNRVIMRSDGDRTPNARPLESLSVVVKSEVDRLPTALLFDFDRIHTLADQP